MSTNTTFVNILKKLYPHAPNSLAFWTDYVPRKGAPLRFVSKLLVANNDTTASKATQLSSISNTHEYQAYMEQLAKLNDTLGSPVEIEGSCTELSMLDWFQVEKSLTVEQIKAFAGKGRSLLHYTVSTQKQNNDTYFAPSLLKSYRPFDSLKILPCILAAAATVGALLALGKTFTLRLSAQFSSFMELDPAGIAAMNQSAINSFISGPTSFLACIGYLFILLVGAGLCEFGAEEFRKKQCEKLTAQISDTWEQVFQSEKVADLMLLGIIRELLDNCPHRDMPDFQSVTPLQAWALVHECIPEKIKDHNRSDMSKVSDDNHNPKTYADWVYAYCISNRAGPHKNTQELVSRSFQRASVTVSQTTA